VDAHALTRLPRGLRRVALTDEDIPASLAIRKGLSPDRCGANLLVANFAGRVGGRAAHQCAGHDEEGNRALHIHAFQCVGERKAGYVTHESRGSDFGVGSMRAAASVISASAMKFGPPGMKLSPVEPSARRPTMDSHGA
jgi:hypothetical protein